MFRHISAAALVLALFAPLAPLAAQSLMDAGINAKIRRKRTPIRRSSSRTNLNTSILKTVKGRTVMLQHDVSNPRPYTRHNRVQGTKGAFEDYPPRICVEGQAGGERTQAFRACEERRR
jgi:hypothetical protein